MIAILLMSWIQWISAAKILLEKKDSPGQILIDLVFIVLIIINYIRFLILV